MVMENRFVNGLRKETNYTTTENGAVALKSTGDDLLNLYGVIGALRGRRKQEILKLFLNAFLEDKLLATKLSFYARDIRGGLGERAVVREIWKFLAETEPEIMKRNLLYVPVFGRWDDMYIFVGTPIEAYMWQVVRMQLDKDKKGMEADETISLLAKWLKSPNASSKDTRKLGRLTAKRLGYTEKEYRKLLVRLRAHIDVVEVRMTNGVWDGIDYPKVPARAMMIYRNAFKKHDADSFDTYIEGVQKGTQKINAGTLYPYDIMEKMGLNSAWCDMCLYNYDVVLEEQWKALPNYVEGENNVLIMADTSGSMTGRPMNTAVGLAIYFAERNKGAFKDKFMTFSSSPSFVELKGRNLKEKVQCIPSIVQDTNLEAAFDLILEVAKNNKLEAEELPKALVVISDMEINSCTDVQRRPFYDSMKVKFAQYGYEIPNIIFWNVDSRHDVFHANSGIKGVQLASGQSVSVFKSVLDNIGKTPYEAMLETLNDPKYDVITVE